MNCLDITLKNLPYKLPVNLDLKDNCGLCTKHYNIRKNNSIFDEFCKIHTIQEN